MHKPVLAIIHGGGCRQIENASGVLQALDEAGVVIDAYRGASAGAIVAALHASGFTGSGLREFVKNTPVSELFAPSWWQWFKLFVPGVKTDSVYSTAGLEDLLNKNIETVRAFLKAKVSVSRLPNYDSLMMQANTQTVLASAAIPEVFPPVEIEGQKYVDGGVKNNIPTIRIKDIPKYQHIYIILCNEDTKQDKTSWTKVGRSLEAVNKTMDREAHQIHESGWNDFDNVTVIQPPPFRSHLLEWSDNFGLIEHSYQYTKSLLNNNN
jgi:NTE family protein